LSQASKKKIKFVPATHKVVRNVKEISFIFLAMIAIYLVMALYTFHPADSGWSQATSTEVVHNSGGVVGAWISDLLLYLFGFFGYLIPFICVFDGIRLFQSRQYQIPINYYRISSKISGFIMFYIGGCGLLKIHFSTGSYLPTAIPGAGGVFGDGVSSIFLTTFGSVGSTLVLLSFFFIGLTLYSGLSWLWIIDNTGHWVLRFSERLMNYQHDLREKIERRKFKKVRETVIKEEIEKVDKRLPPRIEPVISEFPKGERAERERQEHLFLPPADSFLPPLNLLDGPQPAKGRLSREALSAMSRQVELKLKDFGIEVEVVAVNPGPVVTRFELEPAPGVKVNQISNLSKDLARSLSVVSLRVVDIIPGKSVIGLEIPNEYRELVTLGEILNSREYDLVETPLALALGKDISGNPIVTELNKMPHLLVAGTTGSGKSVALNAMILSLLYKATASDIRLIMIDPKMLELSVYEGIPHLLTPVVTDMKEAANALRWCVAEMERRYKLMAALGVRNIAGYNRKIREANERKNPIPDPFYTPVSDDDEIPGLLEVPFIVVIIDELADMMMTVGKKVEELIARLAQKARASGIHLIVATQRPSVDVITGLIKANIPTRIAFQVSSKVDSRTILDQMGAENLLGHGDMLFLPPGTSLPVRVHGAFVDDHEVHKVVENIKARGEPNYMEEIIRGPNEGGADSIVGIETSSDDVDPLYDEAVRIVTETRKASISYIQRRLKIGYNRAARMVEEMENSGLVSALESNGGREVLARPPPKD
jgi:S-DNA-T family DNA segregation ATPase FtsK/SpoIIIE